MLYAPQSIKTIVQNGQVKIRVFHPKNNGLKD